MNTDRSRVSALQRSLRDPFCPTLKSCAISSNRLVTQLLGLPQYAAKSHQRTLDEPFRIASITKTFAATAVLILIDRGLLGSAQDGVLPK
jgi:CubicO group peptidase (beta-lactamase class C family)